MVEVKSYNPDGIAFYLDGVRIYGPLYDQEHTDDEGNITYDSNNYLDSEVDAHIYEIRPMIIGNTVDGDTDNHAMLMQYRPGGELVLSAGGSTVVETLHELFRTMQKKQQMILKNTGSGDQTMNYIWNREMQLDS